MMRRATLTLHVQIIICILSSRTDANTVNGPLPDAAIIRRFLEQIIRPYARIYQNNNISNIVTRRSHVETLVERAIENKINELKPFLQDNDDKRDTDDKLTLEGKDETTIIEYVPKTYSKNITERDIKLRKFKDNIEKYKRLRHKIESLLHEETVTDDTKVLVTKTMDEMIAQLIENQCNWKRIDLGKEMFANPKQITQKELSSKEWQEVKMHYTNLVENKNIRESLTFLHQSLDFFSKISKYFNVQCRVAEDNGLDNTKRRNTKANCDNFQICSNELRKFLNHFYRSLNDTAVSAFRNYAEMYSRDVNTDDSQEKQQVVTVIKNISTFIEHKVNKVFRKEIANLKLDAKKNKDANIKALTRFITDTGTHVMKHVRKHLKSDLNSLRAKKESIIKLDLTVNLNMDMGNLERKYVDRICKTFAVCNNNYFIGGNTRRVFGKRDENNLYVKVQLTLDDDLKEELASGLKKMKQKNENVFRVGTNQQITRTTLSVLPKETNRNLGINKKITPAVSQVSNYSKWQQYLHSRIEKNQIW